MHGRKPIAFAWLMYVTGWTRYPIKLAPVGVQTRLTIAEDELLFDRATFGAHRKLKSLTKLFDIPLAEIRNLDVDIWSAEHSEYSWRPTTGFLHGATRVAATSAVIFTLKSGERVVFRCYGPPAVVRAQLGAVFDRLG
jgi:hypothetical protein